MSSILLSKVKSFFNVEKYDINDSVKFLGYLSHEKTFLKLIEADIDLILIHGKDRYNWGEPIKYIEYSAAALPIIISDLPAKRSLIERNRNGILVDATSITDVVNAVEFLIENRFEAKRMGERGRRSFKARYNWE